jgi:hypothetical protein
MRSLTKAMERDLIRLTQWLFAVLRLIYVSFAQDILGVKKIVNFP